MVLKGHILNQWEQLHLLRKIWFDDSVQRLNVDERGVFLGAFEAKDKILRILIDANMFDK